MPETIRGTACAPVTHKHNVLRTHINNGSQVMWIVGLGTTIRLNMLNIISLFIQLLSSKQIAKHDGYSSWSKWLCATSFVIVAVSYGQVALYHYRACGPNVYSDHWQWLVSLDTNCIYTIDVTDIWNGGIYLSIKQCCFDH